MKKFKQCLDAVESEQKKKEEEAEAEEEVESKWEHTEAMIFIWNEYLTKKSTDKGIEGEKKRS